ncbi:hypothetical protein H4R33_001494 [Dimargaris cristalligena]|uniref:Glycine zipper domain-containing protein n=1 Tax=Dimargaris cristalligena TaxID=215637 RepID=A0A4P9ZPV4_9FUNG|nr:hypothetical protein H4R33_001494 [Dimargaris cristalligena]RKP35393.1 hypothetical protein BJ085DRAFT_32630 [Dimargaris cristalligena]|eukprot:RKP35393.1 hypothetical protein BJ085DRAFT_32630 [Dimargaris cristalligena]
MKLLSSLALVLAAIGTVSMVHANPTTAEDSTGHQPHLQKRWFRSGLTRVGAGLAGAAAGSALLPGVGTVIGGIGGLYGGNELVKKYRQSRDQKKAAKAAGQQ